MANLKQIIVGADAASSSVWETKLWETLAESTAMLADRADMSYGAAEPFVDATDLTITNAAVSGGYCANTYSTPASFMPVMTSASQDGFTVDGTYLNSYYPWQAFDSSPTGDDDSGIWAANLAGSYLTVEFPNPKILTGYSITARIAGYQLQAPTAWTVYGSRDGGLTWVTLDSRSGLSWVGSETKTFSLASAAIGFSVFKFTPTASGDGTVVALGGMSIIGSNALPATVILDPVTVSSATAGKIIFTGYNADAAAILDVGNSGSNKLEVYPVISGTAGSALSFTNESLGSNKWRFTSGEITLTDATSFGVRFQTYARTIAPNFRLYECLFIWR